MNRLRFDFFADLRLIKFRYFKLRYYKFLLDRKLSKCSVAPSLPGDNDALINAKSLKLMSFTLPQHFERLLITFAIFDYISGTAARL